MTPTAGIIATLLFGAGFCLILKVIGDRSLALPIVGYVLEILEIAGICVNYPIYNLILKNSKKKYIFTFFTQGIISVVFRWIKNDCKEEIDTMINLIQHCVGRVD